MGVSLVKEHPRHEEIRRRRSILVELGRIGREFGGDTAIAMLDRVTDRYPDKAKTKEMAAYLRGIRMKLAGRLKPPTPEGLAEVIWTSINNYIAEHTAVVADDSDHDASQIARGAVSIVYHQIRKPIGRAAP